MQLSETIKLYMTKEQKAVVVMTMDEYISTVNSLVSIAVNNCPEAIAIIYAINRIGAIANILHSLLPKESLHLLYPHRVRFPWM